MTYRRILAAIDPYEAEQAALRHAVCLADRYQAQLDVVHVVPIVAAFDNNSFQAEVEEASQQRFESVLAAEGISTLVKRHLLVGSTPRVVTELAKSIGADLIVVGSHGKHGVGLLLGSTSNALVHKAPCDVLTVRVDHEDHCNHLPHEPYKKIMVAVDFEPDNQKVVDIATSLGREHKSELAFIHVVPETASMASVYVPDIEASAQQESEEKMKQLTNALGIPLQNTRVVIGSPKHDILDYAKETACDLIVIGSHARNLLATAVLGSTANAVLHGAKVNVLVVRV